jgi:hypothetical protein
MSFQDSSRLQSDGTMGWMQTGSCEHEARETETTDMPRGHQGQMKHLPHLVVMMQMIEMYGDDVTVMEAMKVVEAMKAVEMSILTRTKVCPVTLVSSLT